MADEETLDLDLSTDEEQEKTNKVEKRIKDLSEKVRLTSTERDELKAAKETVEKEKAAALKDVDFFKNFSGLITKYPASAEYQDKIREKVMAGYEAEDAAIAILAKEGKLTNPSQPKPESPAGGSAINTIKAGAEKSVFEMTQEERRSKLIEAEKQGDISLN